MKKILLSSVIIFFYHVHHLMEENITFLQLPRLQFIKTILLNWKVHYLNSLREGKITDRKGNTVTIELDAIEDQVDSQKKLIVVELLPKQEFKTIKTKAQ